MTLPLLARTAALLMFLESAAGAIEVYQATPLTPESAKAIPTPPPVPTMDEITSRRMTPLRRHETDRVTSKPLDVVYSATIDGVTGQPAAVIYATRLDPVTGRPVDVFKMDERKSTEWVASTQLDPSTGQPVGTVYSRRFDARTGRPIDIVRTVPLRSAPAKASGSRLSQYEERPLGDRSQVTPPPKKTEMTPPTPKGDGKPAVKNSEPAKPQNSVTPDATTKNSPKEAVQNKPAPTRAGLAGTWWCVAPSWSSGVIEIAADGTYTRPGGVKGTYAIKGTDVIFDGPMQAWDNGRAKFEGGNLIFEWTNPDGGHNYFAFRKG